MPRRIEDSRRGDAEIVELGARAAAIGHDAGFSGRERAARRRAIVDRRPVHPREDMYVARGARHLDLEIDPRVREGRESARHSVAGSAAAARRARTAEEAHVAGGVDRERIVVRRLSEARDDARAVGTARTAEREYLHFRFDGLITPGGDAHRRVVRTAPAR